MYNRYLLFIALLFAACKQDRTINTSFYYWKTVYKENKTTATYLNQLHCKKLYVRIMDVNQDDEMRLVPVSPIVFKDSLPKQIEIVPVVYIMNDLLRAADKAELDDLSSKIVGFVNAKVKQAGKINFSELQIDCDWTATTRDNYFYLLKHIINQAGMQGKLLSATLRLHQIKNQRTSGVPPVNRVMLMCYNMGNLRKYGTQNSILDLSELKKYIYSNNIAGYPLPTDVALPLFNWAVAFRNHEYIGISKKLSSDRLQNRTIFKSNGQSMFTAVVDVEEFGLKKGDEIRWENVTLEQLEEASVYLSSHIKSDSLSVAYFHLDEAMLKPFPHADLQKISNNLR